MQLLRMSVLMNETRYFDQKQCDCGKYTIKLMGMNRTWDLDGGPEDLIRPVAVLNGADKGPAVSGYKLGLPDGCEDTGR